MADRKGAIPVCIAGMHRSGTSMIAKLFHLAGVYLGEPSDLMPGTVHNLDGFWENLKFVEVNDEILSQLGGGWDCPVPIPTRWPKNVAVRMTAEALVADFRTRPFWGWKDPRNSLTLPFWQEVVGPLKVVLCLRNPLEVALSLRLRNFFTPSMSLALWKTYNERVLRATSAKDRLVIHYDAFFNNPRSELRRLLAFAQLDVSESVLESASRAIADRLRHHRYTNQDLVTADLAPDLKHLYQRLCREAGGAEIDPRRRTRGRSILSPQAPEKLHGRRVRRRVNPIMIEQQAVRIEEDADRAADLRERQVQDGMADLLAQLTRLRDAVRSQAREREGVQPMLLEVNQAEGAVDELSSQLSVPQSIPGQPRELEDVRAMLVQIRAELQALTRGLAAVVAERTDLRIALRDIERDLGPEHSAIRVRLQQFRQTDYRRLVQRVRDFIVATTPPHARVIVASKGDADFLNITERHASHFPQTADGEYSGYYPGSGLAAVIHLEVLRAKGAEYLVLPRTAFWWLGYYAELKEVLEKRFSELAREDDTCVIFALGAQRLSTNTWNDLEALVTAHEATCGRPASILDWNTELDLARRLPVHAVFQPPIAETPVLPYLPQSVDFVAISSTQPATLDEARRVAAVGVLTFARDRTAAEGPPALIVEWRRRAAGVGSSVSLVVPVTDMWPDDWLRAVHQNLLGSFDLEIVVVSGGDVCSYVESQSSNAQNVGPVTMTTGRLPGASYTELYNEGGRLASGDIVVFVSTDALLLPGWLSWLIRTVREHPTAAAVCGKVLSANGQLQEAGRVIAADGRLAPVGAGSEPDFAAYGYVRSLDCCSGLFLGASRSAFLGRQGFDREYATFEYAVADYCMATRQEGMKILYQPEIMMVDMAPTRPASRDSSTSQARFLRKWMQVLQETPTLRSRVPAARPGGAPARGLDQ